MTSTPRTAPEAQLDVLGIGCAAVDERLYLSQFPAADGKGRILRREPSLGGLTAVALVAAARMGARTAYAGRLGTDHLSQFVEHALREYGVATGDVVRNLDACPGRSTILIDESAGTRTVLSEVVGLRGADEQLPEAELVRQSRVLFVDGHGLDGSIRAAKIAREAGRSVVADFERNHAGDFDTLFGLVDHLILPAAFATARTGYADLAEAAAALLVPGRAAVVVTSGSSGGLFCSTDCAPTRYAAFRVDARDTTGCGDVFHGVYAAGLALGWELKKRIQYAAAAAAVKAAGRGGTDSIPTRAAVEQFLSNNADARNELSAAGSDHNELGRDQRLGVRDEE
ncbi:MAG TPA: PfkB family carbohydrate kinase [Polyangiaceae bacterium]|nr:PfkB family carbohydrate kinase [Polyangiaceae bacterium]